MHWRGAQGLMWGARGPFPPAAAMVVVVMMPVVFCAKATEKQNKNTKNSCLLPKSLFITFIVKHIVIHISLIVHGRARVVAWPEPKPLLSNGPRHIGYRQKALVIVRTILTLYLLDITYLTIHVDAGAMAFTQRKYLPPRLAAETFR